MENKTSGAAKVLSLSGAARKHTSATISAVDDDGAGHAGCMLDLPSAHRSNLLNSSMLPFSLRLSSSSSLNGTRGPQPTVTAEPAALQRAIVIHMC